METRVAGVKEQRSLEKFLTEFNLSEGDGNLNYTRFCSICSVLFPPDQIENDEWRIREIFRLFDLDKDQTLKGQKWKT